MFEPGDLVYIFQKDMSTLSKNAYQYLILEFKFVGYSDDKEQCLIASNLNDSEYIVESCLVRTKQETQDKIDIRKLEQNDFVAYKGNRSYSWTTEPLQYGFVTRIMKTCVEILNSENGKLHKAYHYNVMRISKGVPDEKKRKSKKVKPKETDTVFAI